MKKKLITNEQLVSDLRDIGVKKGDLLHLKVSMRSIDDIKGDADTLISALLEVIGENGTIVSDAFIKVYPLPLSKEDALKVSHDKTPSYAGVFANAMINHPQMQRSLHPIQKFVAIGGEAKELTQSQTENSGGYDLLLYMANREAKNLTIGKNVVGVGTTHVAIQLLGFKKKIKNLGVNFKDINGQIRTFKMNWNGGCGKGFPKFIPLYEERGALIRRGKIGNACAILTNMRKTLNVEMEVLKKDPAFFFCDDPLCTDCRLNWEHSNGNIIVFTFRWLLQILKNKFS